MKKLLSRLKKTLALTLVLLLSASPSLGLAGTGTNINARVITVSSVTGNNAALYRGTSRSITPRPGMRLATGHQLATGEDTNLFFRLDTESIVKMDEESRVEVTTSVNRLTLKVLEGSCLVHIAAQNRGQEFEVQVGNLIFGVRGTMFVIGHGVDYVYITLLSGSGEVKGTPVFEGYRVISRQDEDYVITNIVLEQLNRFNLFAVWNNQNYLLENSDFVTEEVLEIVEYLLFGSLHETRDQTEEGGSLGYDEEYDNEDNGNDCESDSSAPYNPYVPRYPYDPYDPGYPHYPYDPYDPYHPLYRGYGTPASPWLIRNFDDMQWWVEQPNWYRSHVMLADNIYFESGWYIPTGHHSQLFTGTFDGDGYSIRGFDASSPLFGNTINSGGVVKNLLVENGSVNSRFNAGGIVNLNLGTILNVGFTGTVQAGHFQSNFLGAGIVADNSGIITNSFFEGNVLSDFAGGIAAANRARGVIADSFSTGTIYGHNRWAGGIVADNAGIIRNVYSSADVIGVNRAGGIAGQKIGGNMSSVFATGSVISTGGDAGGIIGQVSSTAASFDNLIALNSTIEGGGGSAGGVIGNYFLGVPAVPLFRSFSAAMSVTPGGYHGTQVSDRFEMLGSPWWQTNTNFDFANVWEMSVHGLPILQNVGNHRVSTSQVVMMPAAGFAAPLFTPLFILCEICEEYPCICEDEEYDYTEYEYYPRDYNHYDENEDEETSNNYEDIDKKEPEDDELKEVDVEEEEDDEDEGDNPIIDNEPPYSDENHKKPAEPDTERPSNSPPVYTDPDNPPADEPGEPNEPTEPTEPDEPSEPTEPTESDEPNT